MQLNPLHIERDVVFGDVNGRELKLDLYWPEDVALTRTVVILLHGGGWRSGDRGAMAASGEALARLGFLAAAVEYRLLGEAPWPAQLDDVKKAVAYLADNAETLGVDPGRIAIEGFSAGGHLSLLTGHALRDQVAAVVAFFPVVELVTTPPAEGQAPASMLLGDNADAEAARLASPLHQISADSPPTFLLHGAKDWLTSHHASLRLFDALTTAGAPTELHIYAGHPHEFQMAPYMQAPVQNEVAVFLHRHLVDPEGALQQDLEHNPFAHGPEEFERQLAKHLAG